MTKELRTRIRDIEMRLASGGAQLCANERKGLESELRQHANTLKAQGIAAPARAWGRVRPECDSDVEDMFDNMPV